MSTPVTEEPEALAASESPVRGITSIDHVVLGRLEGDGMVGVPGVAMRLFGALARRGVSVILISQASSEHSICFAVAPEDQAAADAAVDEEFRLDRRAGDIDELEVEDDVAIVAVVGAAMRERPGLAGRLFSVLGERGVNVRAIAQGSSELNISLVVKRPDKAPAVRAIHDALLPRCGRASPGCTSPGRATSAARCSNRSPAAGSRSRRPPAGGSRFETWRRAPDGWPTARGSTRPPPSSGWPASRRGVARWT